MGAKANKVKGRSGSGKFRKGVTSKLVGNKNAKGAKK